MLSQNRLEDELIELEAVEKGMYPVYRLEKEGPCWKRTPLLYKEPVKLIFPFTSTEYWGLELLTPNLRLDWSQKRLDD